MEILEPSWERAITVEYYTAKATLLEPSGMYKNDRADPPRAYLLSLLRAGVKRGGNSVERSLTT